MTLNQPDFVLRVPIAMFSPRYEFCIAQGAGDIHKLDQENDGLACESLP